MWIKANLENKTGVVRTTILNIESRAADIRIEDKSKILFLVFSTCSEKLAIKDFDKCLAAFESALAENSSFFDFTKYQD